VYAPLRGVRRGRRRARDVRRTVTAAPHPLRRSGRPSPDRARSTTASPVRGGTPTPTCTGRPPARYGGRAGPAPRLRRRGRRSLARRLPRGTAARARHV